MSTLLEEKDAIREVLSKYCFCVDRRDADGYAALFTEDAVWDGGAWGRFQGRPAMKEFMSRSAAHGPKLRHLNVNESISITGDTATVRSYLVILNTPADGPPSLFFAGFSEDQLLKQGGRWLIRSRLIQSQ